MQLIYMSAGPQNCHQAATAERTPMELVWEISGWAGAATILTASLSVSMCWLKAAREFQSANLLGAAAFILNGVFHVAWPSVATNAAWLLISAVSLLRMRGARGTQPGAVAA